MIKKKLKNGKIQQIAKNSKKSRKVGNGFLPLFYRLLDIFKNIFVLCVFIPQT